MFCAAPSCSPATDIRILNVDPGASCAWIALFSSGWSGSVINLFHSARSMRTAKAFGSKLGRDTSARISPLRGSMATIAPLRSAQRQLRCLLQVVVDRQPQVLGPCPVSSARCADSPLRVRGCLQSRRVSRPARAESGRKFPLRPRGPPRRPAHRRRSACRSRACPRLLRPHTRSGAKQSRCADRAVAPHRWFQAPAARCGAPQ